MTQTFHLPHHNQVVVYNHMKLQAIKAKVAATAGKDEESGMDKGGER